MIIPLFCQGKTTQRETSQAVGAGTRVIPTADADEHFRAGELLFLSSPDGSAAEFLGTIESVADDSVTTAFATAAAKAPAAKLWTPQAAFEWPVGAEAAARRTRHTGVEVVRALGGDAYATRLQSPYDLEHVRFDNLSHERAGQLAAWFEQQAGGGLEEFTYVDSARDVWRVRLEAPALEWSRTARGLAAVAFDLHLPAAASYV